MFDILNARLAWRFTLSRKGGTLSHFMSIASTAGIAIGVAALIIGLSAMNGFEKELQDRVLSIIPSVTLTAGPEGFEHAQEDIKKIKSIEGVTTVFAGLSINGVIKVDTSFAPVQLLGIKKGGVIEENLQRFISAHVKEKQHPSLPSLVIGHSIAEKLNLSLGSVVTLLSGSNLENVDGCDAEIIGFVQIGGQMDSVLCYTDLDDALSISNKQNPNVIMLKTDELLRAPELAHKAQLLVNERVQVSSWLDTQGKLYNDIQMIRGIMYLAMILVMAVACFNIISNLVMAVAEKSREIAVLKTLGASERRIICTFTLSGLFSGMRGALIGTIAGCTVSLFLTPAMRMVENILGIKFLNKEVYFIDFIPSQLSLCDVILVIATALFMSCIASLYPAWKAARIEPAKELNV